MQAQFEYDLLGYPPRVRGAAAAMAAAAALESGSPSNFGRVDVDKGTSASEDLLLEGGDECGCEDEDCAGDVEGDGEDLDGDVEDTLGIDEEDPLAGSASTPALGDAPEVAADSNTTTSNGKSGAKSRKRSRSRSSPPKSITSDRLAALAKPKPAAPEPEQESFTPEKKPPKKQQSSRPSLLLRLRPTNLEEARDRFFASGFTEAPRFTYAFAEEYVTKHFEENSNVCFELLPEARRILQRVQDEYGGPEAFMQKLYGEEKVPPEEMRDAVQAYVKDHHLEDKVEIRIVESSLSAANVVKPGWEGKYIVNIANSPISKNLVPGICDHEVGTHLLRMMNDEHQVWHGRRDKYGLANPWTTEEGFATLNTYQTMPCKLLYTQALRYWAVCRGAQLGFCELFQEISQHVSDPGRVWQMCCRIKRGMMDTSLPGAFYMDQAYFKGAVEILRHLDEVDFGRLYGGQIALQDMDKVHFVLRREVVRLPRFLNSAEKLKTYRAHCRRLIKENQIETAIERVCKHVFVRTAKEFFKPKNKESGLRATVAIGDSSTATAGHTIINRSLDLSRLEDLSRPRQLLNGQSDSETGAESDTAAARPRRDVNKARLLELSQPRSSVLEAEEAAVASNKAWRTLDLKHIEELAKPRQTTFIPSDGKEALPTQPVNMSRLMELAAPRQIPANIESGPATSTTTVGSAWRRDRSRSSVQAGDEEAPPPPPAVYDPTRLAALAAPRRSSCADGEACACPPTKAKRRRGKRSRHRLLALVQEKRDAENESELFDENFLEKEGSENENADAVEMNDKSRESMEIAENGEKETRRASSNAEAPEVHAARDFVKPAPSRSEVDVMQELVDEKTLRANEPVVSSSPAEIDSFGSSAPSVPGFGSSITPTAAESTVGLSNGSARVLSASSLRRPMSETRANLEADTSSGVAASGTSNQQQKPRSESRLSRRAVARARSLGPEGAAAPAPLPLDGGGGVREFVAAGLARRQRLPVGLPKGAAAAVAGTQLLAVGTGLQAGGSPAGEAWMWKAVPIKTLQLGI